MVNVFSVVVCLMLIHVLILMVLHRSLALKAAKVAAVGASVLAVKAAKARVVGAKVRKLDKIIS